MRFARISTPTLVVLLATTATATPANAGRFGDEAAAAVIDHPVGWLADQGVRAVIGPDIGILVQFSFIVAPDIPLPDGADDLQSWLDDEALADWPP
jgi:hypothetical protein